MKDQDRIYQQAPYPYCKAQVKRFLLAALAFIVVSSAVQIVAASVLGIHPSGGEALAISLATILGLGAYVLIENPRAEVEKHTLRYVADALTACSCDHGPQETCAQHGTSETRFYAGVYARAIRKVEAGVR